MRQSEQIRLNEHLMQQKQIEVLHQTFVERRQQTKENLSDMMLSLDTDSLNHPLSPVRTSLLELNSFLDQALDDVEQLTILQFSCLSRLYLTVKQCHNAQASKCPQNFAIFFSYLQK